MNSSHTDTKPPYICITFSYTLIDCLKHFCIKEKFICVLYKTLLREVYSTCTVHGNISCYTSPIRTNILQSERSTH